VELAYRENLYFNTEDLFILNNNLEHLTITKVHFYNGNWYSDVGCNYKMTSVRSINSREVYHNTVEICGIKGVVAKFLSSPNNDLGVMWESGEAIRKYGMPNYWQNINNLNVSNGN
jgi:hypothetical protein